MFIATGVIASLASHVYTLAFKLPKALAMKAGKHAILPSLGASGAIYATVVVTALGKWDLQLVERSSLTSSQPTPPLP
jgi:rhomboid-like protein